MATTGLLYFFYNSWPAGFLGGALEPVALLHTVGAFLLVGFLIIHVYMTTTGRTLTSNIGAMFTGYKTIRRKDEEPGGAGKRVIQQ
jgi:thiosulfate reductase cytochrome b subunit